MLDAVRVAVTRVPRDVYEVLARAVERESGLARRVLETIVESVRVAARDEVPLCQDTGVPVVFLRVGEDVRGKARLPKIVARVVRKATEMGLLRPNAVDPVSNVNTGDNTGRFFPEIYVEIVEGSDIETIFAVRGGGCEGVSRATMALPSRGWEELARFVVESVVEAGPKPCPPTFLGIGVAATMGRACVLAREALILRRCGSRNPNPFVAKLEDSLLRRINELGIGPAGLGGETTVLDVRIEYGHRHPATFAIAVAFSCWALRRARFVVSKDGSVVLDPLDFWSPRGA